MHFPSDCDCSFSAAHELLALSQNTFKPRYVTPTRSSFTPGFLLHFGRPGATGIIAMGPSPNNLRQLRPQPGLATRASVGRRRNGKLQSCEPCRKSKLACNHETPCSRCLRRRLGNQCVYHPNPLSKVSQSRQKDRILSHHLSSALLTPSRIVGQILGFRDIHSYGATYHRYPV